jgi:hypothetical protein|tara:strand:- start:84 stop:194 length:111 start_codon:yes stop_codon:yes gene_type:complete
MEEKEQFDLENKEKFKQDVYDKIEKRREEQEKLFAL